MEQKRIDISTGIILRTIAILVLLWLLYIILDILVILFISVIIVAAIDPAVDWMQKKKIPRSLGVLIIYFILFLILGVSIYFIIPPIVNQAQELAREFPVYYQRTIDFLGPAKEFIEQNNLDKGQILANISDSVSNLSKNIFTTTVGVFSGLISIIVVISLTFYMSAEENAIRNFVVSVTPKKHQEYAAKLTERIKDKIGKWLIGQLALMLIVGILVYTGLLIIGVPHALLLGVFAGIMEIIPYVGPLVGAIPGVIIGFIFSPLHGLLAIAVYMVVQQLENHVVTPQVMKKAVGLSPITIILVLLIGAKLYGALGAILSIPVATAVGLFIRDVIDNRNEKENGNG
jgi:predicted PurR-regulated permease PerM